MYRKMLPMGCDWLSGQVAMVKVAIKAIKAAGVGLNGSSDGSRCRKLNRKAEKQKGRRMGETWKKWNSMKKSAVRRKIKNRRIKKCG